MGLVQTANNCYLQHFFCFVYFLGPFYARPMRFCGVDQCLFC